MSQDKPAYTSRIGLAAAGAWALLAAACSGGPAALPELPAVSGLAAVGTIAPTLKIEPAMHHIPSAEAYSRVARGANACWFGPRGRLSASHIFHADAAPAASGGAVEITVHERAFDQPKPWGYKAYRITMTETAGVDGTPSAGGTKLGFENLRMPDAEAARMRAEVVQWADGTEGCKDDPAADQELAARYPKPAPPPAAPVASPAKAKSGKGQAQAQAK